MRDKKSLGTHSDDNTVDAPHNLDDIYELRLEALMLALENVLNEDSQNPFKIERKFVNAATGDGLIGELIVAGVRNNLSHEHLSPTEKLAKFNYHEDEVREITKFVAKNRWWFQFSRTRQRHRHKAHNLRLDDMGGKSCQGIWFCIWLASCHDINFGNIYGHILGFLCYGFGALGDWQ